MLMYKYISKIDSFFWFALALSAFLIFASKDIAFHNQGDFARSISFFLDNTVDGNNSPAPSGFIWTYKDKIQFSQSELNSASFYFYFFSLLQKFYSHYYDIYFLSLISKAIILFFLVLISIRVIAAINIPSCGRFIVFFLFSTVYFSAHNIGILNSFYQEHVFYVFFPVLLFGLLNIDSRLGVFSTCMGILACSLAKTQYFYLPLLLLAVLKLSGLLERKTAVFLLAIQLICFVQFSNNDYSRYNYYHSVFLGSYLVLDKNRLENLGVAEDALSCIGVDAWGNKIAEGSVRDTPVDGACFDRYDISFYDAIHPYLRYPQTFVHLFLFAFPAHFTVNYFHVYPDLLYIIPSDGKAFHAGDLLTRLTDMRDKAGSFFIPLILLGSILFLWRNARNSDPFRPASLFILVFVVSQVAICLLGEGIRDLSKHLAASQLAIDLLGVFCICQIPVYIRRRTSAAVTSVWGSALPGRPLLPAKEENRS